MSTATLWGVILAGGSGTRFWPLSTPARPKQFLPLAGEAPLLRDSVDRLLPMIPAERLLVLTSAALADGVRTLAPELPAANVLVEPRAAGTAAALAFAARHIAARDPGAVMCCVHADWTIGDAPAFRDTLQRAARAAERHGALATVGIVATRPDPGFGYLLRGDALDADAARVARFVEKPTRERAAALLAEGGLWNSGIFVWEAQRFLAAVRAHTPELAAALATPTDDAAAFFAAVITPVSVDVGVMERAPNVIVLPGDFGWDDVGTWAALHRVRAHDAADNAVHGAVTLLDAHDNVVHAEGGHVVLYGVSDLVVVRTSAVTMVTTRERAADLKALLDVLPPALRDQP
jgi:mannose-1-phosphate guanylyltransferase